MSGAEDALLGAVTRAGQSVLASLPLTGGTFGASGALAVSATELWLSQPQLLGGPAVASVARGEVRRAVARRARFGGYVLDLQLDGRRVRLTTRASGADVEAFLAVLGVVRD
ncbi:hypothetical protein [Kineococcus rhizosphaerae]|uniref:YokE-like PH domain-containing protein n=1 Tax=Kineococcus rhizosphaerae TaxID=559628 RepID=A0A2T0R323_9ACTN|nr:hypothetical protein [Kineococcus rhizosphaerae]PRY14446.1 hypothetical protein CLV37_1064 [Kineococcus rhizosphaerae]